MKNYCELLFKEEQLRLDFTKVHPKMLRVVSYLLEVLYNQGIGSIVVTNVLKKFPQSVSNTHPEGRAIDFSTNGIDKETREKVEEELTLIYGHLGAISKETGLRRLIYFHDAGLGEHWHIQISRELLD